MVGPDWGFSTWAPPLIPIPPICLHLPGIEAAAPCPILQPESSPQALYYRSLYPGLKELGERHETLVPKALGSPVGQVIPGHSSWAFLRTQQA